VALFTRQIRKAFSIWLLHLEDFLRTRNVAAFAALAKLPAAFLSFSRVAQMGASVTIANHYPNSSLGRVMLSRANQLSMMLKDRIPLESAVSISRSVIVKPYVSKREPGVLLVSFESELAKLARLEHFSALEADYRIVFLPTWQPFYSEALCLLAARSAEPFFVMPSAFSEEPLCSEFSPQCNYLPFHAASWVRSDLYGPPSEKKTIDILMIATFSRHKRHWKLFEALASLPSRLQVVLAGVRLGARSSASLLNEARLFGVEDRIKIIEGATDQELRRLLSSAKLFCAMTHKEGSYIAVAEALMAGVPVAMFETAKIGSKVYVTDATGFRLASDKPLGPQLEWALERSTGVESQAWAKSNISAEVNCKKLNELLRRWASLRETDWTRDIEPFFCEHFEFRYLQDTSEEEMAREYTRVQRSFGLTVSRT
jgi:glycosyltransferase involved in cell wall biosynthesis